MNRLDKAINLITSVKYTFALLMLMAVTFHSRVQTASFLIEMRARLENSKKYTLDVAKAMPEAQYDYKPVADEMTFRGQLLHMAQNVSWLTSTHLTTKPNPITEAMLKDVTGSKESVEATVGKAFDYAIEAVRDFDPAHLDEPVKFFAGSLSKRQIMMLINDHQAHHRGQLVVYLRMNNVKPPAYVGW